MQGCIANPRPFRPAVPLVLAAAVSLSGPLSAQETPEPESLDMRVSVTGVVYDVLSGTALTGAVVSLENGDNGVVTDAQGIFLMEDVEAGPHVFVATQFGYEKRAIARAVAAESGQMIEVALTPRPFMLQGITAIAENITEMEKRIRFRRRASEVSSRAYDRQQLARALSGTPLDFLFQRTLVRLVPCPPGTMNSRCVWRRGRAVDPSVYVDEIPAFGGLDELESYAISDIYLMEVYSLGTQIRVYTNQFMERMARRPVMLIPLNLWTRSMR